jgi:ectoine hydroxylase-related dioxygenase (phytanoyl-CoA dioxygenase family)
MKINTTLMERPCLKTLSHSQVNAYQEEGFLILRSVFSATTVEALGKEVDEIARQHRDRIDAKNMRVRFKPDTQTGEPIFEVFDPIADLSPIAYRMAHDERVLNILHDLYGEPAVLFKEKLIYKPPRSLGATLHQDWIAWPGFPESFLTVLVAIDPFTAEAGATEVYPGLHRRGYLSTKDGQHHYLEHDSLGVSPVPLLLYPGDVAIFGCFAPHRSAPNNSSTSRRGYFMSYNALSDGGDQYEKHYREFHDWIRRKAPADIRDQLYFR